MCGSSNVLEKLGVRFTNDRDALRRSLERAGVCFLHAPLFHPALKRAAHVRRELGIRTVFNILGPLVNPANPTFQMNGVYDLELLRLYSYLLSRRGIRFGVVHSLDGYDELSLTGSARVVWNFGTRDVSPHDLGLALIAPEELRAHGGAEESAALLLSVLNGRGTAGQEAVVIANAALAMWCRNVDHSIEEYVQTARESIRSGAARRALELSTQE
jgi:anthranilate phosphoribosyltransferase